MNRFSLALMAGAAGLAIMSSAHAADLIMEEAPMVGVVDVSGSWEGPYVGIFGGWATGTADDDPANGGFGVPGSYPDGIDIGMDGWLVGVKAGANFYLTDTVVAGIVGDLAWSDISGEFDESVPPFNYDGTAHSINWQGSVRGIVGVDAGSFLPYLTAGLAFAEGQRFSPYADLGDEPTATHMGWTVGAGLEMAVTEQISANLEYRYSDFGSADYDWTTAGATDRTIGLSTHAITAGLNFRF